MVKINERYDDVIETDPAYNPTNTKPVDTVNKFISDFIVDPVKQKLKSKEQAILEVGEIVAKPFNVLGQALDTGKTVSELQNIATTDPGFAGLVAQAQVVPQGLSNTLKFLFEPQFYSGLREKINRGEATGFERALGIVSAIGEIAGGDELLRFAIKKFGPGIRPFFDNLSPEEKADPVAVIGKMPISEQQKIELGEEILGGGKTVEKIQETIMREPDIGGAGGSTLLTDSPPSNINSREFRLWRENTARKIVEDLIAKTNPEELVDGKIVRADAHDAIRNYFKTNYPQFEQGRTGKYYQNLIDKVKPAISDLIIQQSPGSTQNPFMTRFVANLKKTNPDAKGQPLYKYINFKAEEFFRANGERPDLDTLANYIKQTDPQAVSSFTDLSANGLDRIIYNQGVKKGNVLPEPSKIFYKRGKLFTIGNTIKDLQKNGVSGKFTPFEFNNDYQMLLSKLRQTDSMLRTIKGAFDTHLAKYTNEFNEPIFNYDSFTQFLRDNQKELKIPPRLFSFDDVNYSAPITSSKAKREINEVDKFLGGEKVDYRRPSFEGLTLPTPMRNFLTHMYRGMLQNQKKLDKDGNVIINKITGEPTMEQVLLNNKEFVDKYVMPFVGGNTQKTVSNLTQEYPEYAQWLRLEKKVEKYQNVLGNFIEELKASGKYTDREIEFINSSLAPQKAHIYPITTNLKDERFVGMAQDANNILVQPAVYNQVYQKTFDNVFKKLLNQFEGKQTLQKLQTGKPKSIGDFKNSFNFDVSVTKFLNETNIDNPRQIDYLNFIYQTLNDELQKRGMVSVQSFNPKQKDIFKGLKFNQDTFINPEDAGDVLIVGDPNVFTQKGKAKDYSPEFYMTVAKEILNRNPDKLPLTAPIPKKGAKKDAKNFVLFNQGGPVRMAIGGDPLQNINQQQFAPDPAMDDDFFKKAVDSGNLQAFGAGNLFKIFGKVPGLLTPKKVASDIPTGTGTTPMVPKVDPGDFPFKSFFIESTTNPNAPKSALPKDWLKYYTGKIGVPQAEMKDAGIFNYLEDIEKFFPNTKLTQQNLIDVYESSPIANIEVKIKREPTGNTPPGSLGAYMGKPTHKGQGSQSLDNQGENYREIVVNVDKLPGQETQFFNASHFGKDPNVIAFTRVADYKDVNGNTVAAIQEIQTDMLTNLKKEQERMKATAVMIRNYKEKLKTQIAQGETYQQDLLEKMERDYPESMLKFMETSDLVRPNNPTFADQLTPDVVKELTEIQERITTIANQNRARVVDPDFQNKIVALQEEGRQKFNALFELNRGTNYEDQLKNIKILDVDNTDELAEYAQTNPTYGVRFRPVQSFPVLPFNKGKDYIDLLLKATIQDAQANGINKVAIFPSELVNRRWGKDPDGPAGKKFKTIYDNITVQEMKNIAKKYTGSKNNLKIEEIVDKSKADKGLKFYNKNVDGELELLKDFEPSGRGTVDADDLQGFLDTEIERVALDFGPNEVVIRREIAPGQTMEYFVQTKKEGGFELVPLGDGDRAENATIIIDEYNPQRVKMFTLTLPEETTKQGPMFIYGKKDGGKIASDGLVSITDIFGEY